MSNVSNDIQRLFEDWIRHGEHLQRARDEAFKKEQFFQESVMALAKACLPEDAPRGVRFHFWVRVGPAGMDRERLIEVWIDEETGKYCVGFWFAPKKQKLSA